jgi:CRP/FNR family cyclic AMP-dependent transcriptional regulator
VAGANKVLKDGQILFKAGDKSDGMYLIRRGELRIYLEQNGKEVTLVTIGSGGMVGEMALFDGQPRSASVKAVKEAEVTHITADDFGKLMKQIPKWFVSLMTSLSGRLRQTNERLQKLEGGGGKTGAPFQDVLRQLNVMILLWAKDGEKDGKDRILQKAKVEDALINVFGENSDRVKRLFEVLVKEKCLITKTDTYNNVVFSAPHRAVLNNLTTFMQTYLKANPKQTCLSDQALTLLKTLEKMATTSPYDTLSVSVGDLERQAKQDGIIPVGWNEVIATLQNAGEEVRPVKTSSGIGLRTSKKDIAQYVRHHQILAALNKATLS